MQIRLILKILVEPLDCLKINFNFIQFQARWEFQIPARRKSEFCTLCVDRRRLFSGECSKLSIRVSHLLHVTLKAFRRKNSINGAAALAASFWTLFSIDWHYYLGRGPTSSCFFLQLLAIIDCCRCYSWKKGINVAVVLSFAKVKAQYRPITNRQLHLRSIVTIQAVACHRMFKLLMIESSCNKPTTLLDILNL